MQTKDDANATRRTAPGHGPIHLEHARILGHEDDLLVLATAGGEVRLAAKADGCLLLPQKGDLVLVALGPNTGASHVLCVLQRAEESQQGRDFDLGPGLRLNTSQGALGLQAQALRLDAAAGEANFLSLRLAARSFTSVADKAKVVVRSLDQQAGRVMQRLGSCFRRIQGLEHVIAERSTLIVHRRLTQKAQNASLQAEENVSINGEHIDLG